MAPNQTPPDEHLWQLLFGFVASRSLSVAATFNIADALVDGPRHCDDLAKSLSVDAGALCRLLRLLSSIGVFTEIESGTYGLNPVAELLRSDHPTSLRDLSIALTADAHWLPWGKFPDVVRSGVSGPRHAFGTDFFSWLQEPGNESEWEIFNAAMTSFSSSVAGQVSRAYDFSECRTIVDIGGGHGLLLSEVLKNAPQARGIVFDLPGVIEAGDPPDGPIEMVGGSFFEAGLPRGDTYLLKHIIHDWGDESSSTILRNIVDAMAPNGKVLIIETIMPEGPEPHPAKFLDLNMLALTEGGCERTEPEFRKLLAASGLRLAKIYPTQSPVGIVEAFLA